MLSDEQKTRLADAADNRTLGTWHEEFLEHLVERIVAEQVEAARAERLCSQCGERMSCMLKIGSGDGWCTVCLDEAAERALVERIEAVLPKADDALSRWRTKGPTSLTIALCVEALMEVRAALVAVASTDEETGR